jgi:hypothetical protein
LARAISHFPHRKSGGAPFVYELKTGVRERISRDGFARRLVLAVGLRAPDLPVRMQPEKGEQAAWAKDATGFSKDGRELFHVKRWRLFGIVTCRGGWGRIFRLRGVVVK